MANIVDLTERKERCERRSKMSVLLSVFCKLCGIADLLLVGLVIVSVVFSHITHGEVPNIISGDLAFKQFAVIALGLFLCSSLDDI